MAAGLGFEDFVTGEVLTAADVDGYLMQGVWVFASAAARDAAVTSPQEGNFAYLKDTNVTTYYTGSAWANLDTTGMTNPMTTTGDTIYSSSGSTPARLGIGSTGQVLTVAAGLPGWATPAGGGGMTQIATGSLSGASTTISTISGSYKNLILFMTDWYSATSTHYGAIRINNDSSGSNHMWTITTTRVTSNINNSGANEIHLNDGSDGWSGSQNDNFMQMTFYDYANSTTKKVMSHTFIYTNDSGSVRLQNGGAAYKNSTPAAITDISMLVIGGSSWAGGSYVLYGVN